MSSIGSVASQNNPIISAYQNTQTNQTNSKDGDGDHGVEPAAVVSPLSTTPAAGQPGAIINTTA